MMRFLNCRNFVLFLVALCVNLTPTVQNLYELALQQGLSQEDADQLYHLQDPHPRIKRQKQFTRSEETNEVFEDSMQPVECGINGKSQTNVKLTNPSSANDWPWLAVLLNKNHYDNFCGGALLNKHYILTAAHCFESKGAADFIVRLGEYDLTMENETQVFDHEVAEVKMHPDFSSSTNQHDIALLRLKTPAKYTQYIRPICLPTGPNEVRTNKTSIVAGWGAIFYGGITSNVLLEVSVPIWDLNRCISRYVPTVFNTNLCAAGYEGGKDSCVGDSGGPLVMQMSNGRWTNIGIVSWGISCGDQYHPGIYTKVNSYLNWIRKNMEN